MQSLLRDQLLEQWCASLVVINRAPLLLQLALEIHDIGGGLKKAEELLRIEAGFDTVITEQDPGLTGSTLFTVFCTRN